MNTYLIGVDGVRDVTPVEGTRIKIAADCVIIYKGVETPDECVAIFPVAKLLYVVEKTAIGKMKEES